VASYPIDRFGSDLSELGGLWKCKSEKLVSTLTRLGRDYVAIGGRVDVHLPDDYCAAMLSLLCEMVVILFLNPQDAIPLMDFIYGLCSLSCGWSAYVLHSDSSQSLLDHILATIPPNSGRFGLGVLQIRRALWKKTGDDQLFNWTFTLSALAQLPSLHRTGLTSSFLCICLRDGEMTDDFLFNFPLLMNLVVRSRSGELLKAVIEALESIATSADPVPDAVLAGLIGGFNLVDDDEHYLTLNFHAILGFVKDRDPSHAMQFLTQVSDAKYVSLFITGPGEVMGDYLCIVTTSIHFNPSLCELFQHPFLFASMERCYIGEQSSFFARMQWLRFCHALLFRSEFPFVNLICSERMRMISTMRAFMTHHHEEEEEQNEGEEEQQGTEQALRDHDPEEEGHLEYCIHIISLMLDRSETQNQELRHSIIEGINQSPSMRIVLTAVAGLDPGERSLTINNWNENIDLVGIAADIVAKISPGW
jgi:hypothetical protein